MDLAGMNKSELKSLLARVIDELRVRTRQDKSAAIERIFQIAREVGMPVAYLVPGSGPSKKPRKARAPSQRYVDPTNPANVWMGAGPRPAWLKAALNAGVSLEHLKAA
ncbi:H-NS family nucleoid-associated regulatory protein [Duganella sp. FT27W]|uniref:H-NS histone family protein n=1 Tax=Duganella sp. FT27W TaxID=2654636 RepID=UPI00128E3A40|nr:H-NS histone family protein [Duganella sp. FT27W]MPQ56253.1 H-NS histone family protein [Duganella sp. FT27W]